MKRSSVAQVEEPPLSDCSWDHEAHPSVVEEALFDSHNADESYEEGVDKYFGDYCMSDEHDWNLGHIFILNLLGPFLFVFDILEI